MRAIMLVALLALGWTQGAGAAVHIVNFHNLAQPPGYPFTPGYVDGVRVDSSDGSFPITGLLQDIGFATGGYFTQDHLSFSTGSRFDAQSFHVIGLYSELANFAVNPNCSWADPNCTTPYINAYAIGYRNGKEVSRLEFPTMGIPNSGKIFDVILPPSFANLDSLVIGAATPGGLISTAKLNFSGYVCTNNVCGEFAINNLVLVDTSFSSAVPEPATWAMILLGFSGIAVAGKRRRRLQT